MDILLIDITRLNNLKRQKFVIKYLISLFACLNCNVNFTRTMVFINQKCSTTDKIAVNKFERIEL